MAVAVVIDGVVEVMRRQELRLAEFAGPRTDHLACCEIAAIDDLQRGDGLLLEHLGAAAVVCQRHQRRQRMQLAQFGAKTALQPPERGDHGRRHPIFLLGAVECCRMHPDSRLRIFCRAIGGPVPGEFGEHLAEHALAAVAVDDALVVDEVGCGFGERALRHAGGDRLLPEVGEEAIETHAVVAGRAAARGGGGRPRRCWRAARSGCCCGPDGCDAGRWVAEPVEPMPVKHQSAINAGLQSVPLKIAAMALPSPGGKVGSHRAKQDARRGGVTVHQRHLRGDFHPTPPRVTRASTLPLQGRVRRAHRQAQRGTAPAFPSSRSTQYAFTACRLEATPTHNPRISSAAGHR